MEPTTPATVAPAAPPTPTAPVEGTQHSAKLEQAPAPEDTGYKPAEQPQWQKDIDAIVTRAEQAREKKEQEEAKAKAAEEAAGLLEGESWDSVYKSQPPEVQRAMAQLRKDYTKKTQELAAQRKALDAQMKALAANPTLEQALAAPPPTGEVDPFDPKSLSAHIEAEVKRRLAEVLAPVREQHNRAEAQARYDTFMAQHPELTANKELRVEVAAALKADPRLTLENAYYAVKGRRAAAAESEAARRAALEQRAVKAAALNVTTGPRLNGRVVPDIDAKADAWTIYQQLAKAKGV